MSEGLGWPPRKEDLERMYLVEKLSAAKIAIAYGLKYKNPKVAESTVLYHLSRNDIARRDRAEHIRRVTEVVVDDWVRRYQSGESLKSIASGEFSPITVWNHLRTRNTHLRDKVNAQIAAVTKYQRREFAGDSVERAYLMGLRYGDLDAARHGRAVRVRVSTTHPAMANLFESLFAPYGHVHRYPREGGFTRFEWTLECDLDGSFGFLLGKLTMGELEALNKKEFISFLAGFFDAEGSILFHKKGRWGGFELVISNMDLTLLELIEGRLEWFGYHAVIRKLSQDSNRGVKGGQDHLWRLEVVRGADVRRLLDHLPLRHQEKRAKANIACLLLPGPSQASIQEVREKWLLLIDQIKEGRDRFVLEAAAMLSRRATKEDA